MRTVPVEPRVRFRWLLLLLGLCGLGRAADAPSSFLDRTVRIQPIQVCSTDGAEVANPQGVLYMAETRKIWAQAGMDVVFLPTVRYSNSVYLQVSSDPFAVDSFLSLAKNAGHGQHLDPTVINLWFVKTVDGASSVYGFALQTRDRFGTLIENNGVAIADCALDRAGGAGMRDIIAHEMGHNLGLDHDTLGAGGAKNLMSASTSPKSVDDIYPDGAQLGQLTAEQVARVRATSFAVMTRPLLEWEWSTNRLTVSPVPTGFLLETAENVAGPWRTACSEPNGCAVNPAAACEFFRLRSGPSSGGL